MYSCPACRTPIAVPPPPVCGACGATLRGPSRERPPRGKPARPWADASNPRLEAAILAGSDDPAPWLVYADFLQSHGDVRGELSALAGGLLANTFIEENAEALLAGFAEEYLRGALLIPRWRFGFVHTALLSRRTTAQLAQVTAVFLRLPATRFVRELCLSLDHSADAQNPNWAPVIAAAAARGDSVGHLELWHGSSCGTAVTIDGLQTLLGGGFRALRHLGIHNCGSSLALLGMLSTAKLLPRLTSLDLSGGRMTHLSARLFVDRASDFAHLERLDLSFNTLGESDAAAIAQALPRTRVNTADQAPGIEAYSRGVRDALNRGR